jgi:hypothetical protein
MNRIFSILFNTLAIIALLVSVSIPHHHHEDMVCVVASREHCHDCNTKYASHNHDDQKNSDNDCIAKTSYVASDQSELIYKIRRHDEDNHNILFIPVFLCIVDLYCTGTKYVYLTKRRCKKKIFYPQLEYVNRINGLRAPPYSRA